MKKYHIDLKVKKNKEEQPRFSDGYNGLDLKLQMNAGATLVDKDIIFK